MLIGRAMKLKPRDTAAAATLSLVNWFSGTSLAAFLTIVSASAGVPQTDAEKWVVKQATAGEIADLSKRYTEEKDRKLSAQFLEDLLTGALPGFKPHRHGVRIIWAIIDEPIDLTNAQIPCEVCLVHCQFNKSVTSNRASFAGNVLFNNSTVKANANFNSMKVGASAFFKGAVFEGPVNFGSADIAGNFEADGAKFQNQEQEASFNAIKVGNSAFFRKAIFEGPVNFVTADIAGNFEANEAKFQNQEKEANFNGMKVGGSAFFSNAVFEGPVNFSDADFAWLDLSSPFWPKVAAQFHMGGMSYKYICAVPERNESESHKALLKLANQSTYTADVYSNLEEFFLRQGYRGDADRAFIAGKRRERKENLHGVSWVGSW